LDLFFCQFYSEFKKIFHNSAKNCGQLDSNNDLKPWKMLGDELIFCVKLMEQSDILSYLQCFIDSREKFKKEIIDKSFLGNGLDLQSTAWIAGFPVGNLSLRKGNDSNPFDYIGPAMDTGFRLSKLSSPERTPISIDLAYAICCGKSFEFKIYYLGKETLKGVLQNKPYPVFYIDHRKSPQLEDNLLKKESLSRDRVEGFAKEFILQNNSSLFLPFIYTDSLKMGELPTDYIEQLGQANTGSEGLESVTSSSENDGGHDISGEEKTEMIPKHGQ